MRFIVALFCLLFASSSWAQTGTTVKQSGGVTPTHAVCWTTNGTVQDCGTAAIPFLTTLGTVGSGPTICANTATPQSGAYNQLCLGGTTTGGGVISFYNYGGGTGGLLFDVNGTTFYPESGAFTPQDANTVLAGPTAGSPATPAFRKLVGADLPFPAATSLGGVESITQVAHQWVDYIDTLGVPHQSQPAISDISGLGTGVESALSNAVNASGGILTYDIIGTSGATVPLLNGTNIWSNPQYFGNINPWCDPRAYGALGNASHDDSPAFADCVTELASTGGDIRVGPGNYCLDEGFTETNSIAIRLVVSTEALLQTCSHDVTLITLNNAPHQIIGGQFLGAMNVNTTNPTISIGSAATYVILDDVYVSAGYYAIANAGQDGHWNNVVTTFAYGPAVIYNTGSYSCNACKQDQPYPVATPSFGTSFSAWAASTPYTVGTIVSSGGFLIQAANSGTSGATAPTIQNFLTYTQDNVTGTCPSPSAGICWFAFKPTTQADVQLDSGSFTVTYSNRSDFSGVFDYGIYITNTTSGGAPGNNIVTDSFFSDYLYDIYQSAGNNLTVKGSIFSNCVSSNCIGIYLAGNGDSTVLQNTIFVDLIGINIAGSGENYLISQNQIFGSTAAINIGGTGVKNVSIIGNALGSSTAWGANTNAIQLNSSTDYITILGNDCLGVSLTCVSSSSTGIHNFIQNPESTFETPISIGNNKVATNTPLLDLNLGTVPVNPQLVPELRLQSADANATVIESDVFNTSTGGFQIAGYFAGGTSASPAAAPSGAIFENITGYGYSGSSYILSAAIQLNADSLFTTSNSPSHIRFLTTPTSSTSITEAARFQPSGGLSIGTTTDPGKGGLTLTGQQQMLAARTIASASGATLDDIDVAAETTTVTGTTTITELAKTHLYQPTLTDSSSVTVTTAATLAIDAAPTASGSLTITHPWALLVSAGATSLGGTIFATGMPTSSPGGSISAICWSNTAGELWTDTSATICGVSAARYKNLIREITPNEGLKILSLRPELYRYKPAFMDHGKHRHISLIADDMAKMNADCAEYKDGEVENYMDRCFEAYQVAFDKKIYSLIKQLERHQ